MKYVVCTGAALALCTVAGASFAASAAHHHKAAIPAYIEAAVNDSTRPDSDRMRDANRKPAELLAFAGVKPGMKIGELQASGGYYSRILCRIVGDSGHLYRVDFTPHRPAMPAGAAAGPRPGGPRPGARPRPQPAPLGCDNVTSNRQDESALTLPSGLDMVLTTDNYHDFHDPMLSGKPVGQPDMMALDMAVYNALKPGGIFLINDHVAAAGSGMADTNTLHRIDPALVKQEVEAVGFKLVGSSNALHNTSDDHTQRVFTMVDHTDEFILKFRKPAA
jgi:predicted methyltransferase